MGTSHPESRPWIMDKIRNSKPKSILDVGAGSGTYADMLKTNGYNRASIDAVEVWKPYIEEFNLENKYTKVYEYDIRQFKNFKYDLVIFGDILEHMTKEDALGVWSNVSQQAKNAVIAIPIIHYHQGAINGNPYEEHVKDDWSHEEVLDTFPGIIDSYRGEVVGAYWAEFIR
jgi:2-polyprenyl-3-methyl-5-hydroxy-6-metoxy-1,4-benzoquinol methylase